MVRRKLGLSEERLAQNAHVSRSTLRHIEAHETNLELNSIGAVAEALQLDLVVMATPEGVESELSTVGISFQIMKDGFSSWKTHVFNFIDEFRRTLDPRLLLLPPPHLLELKLKSLLASIACTVSEEAKIDAPAWAKKKYFLNEPWFISESENLKASALLESPIYFRANNIFVLNNFLERI